MRRATPALCVAVLLAIPIVSVGMHDPAAATPIPSVGAARQVAGPLGAASPEAAATFSGLAPTTAIDAFPAGFDPAAQPTRAFEAAPAIVPGGIPVVEPPAAVGSPALGFDAPLAPPPMTAPAPSPTDNMVALFPTVPTSQGMMPSPLPATAPAPAGADNMVALVPNAGPAMPPFAPPPLASAPAAALPPLAAQSIAPGPAGPTPEDLLAAWGPPPAPALDPRRFTEAHWQGLELVPKTPRLAAMLKLPPEVPGVVVDDVTLPADLQGFQAGDLVTHVAQTPTPHLLAFVRATELVRDQPQARVDLVRNGQPQALLLTALMSRLETANGDSPPMIPPGARMPHPYRGACTNCHRIGTVGALAADQGDAMTTVAPDIRVGARRPHEDRGPCAACHRISP